MGDTSKQFTRRRAPSAPNPNLPEWVLLTKRYLAGDVRAGVRAASSVARWRRRYYPDRRDTP